MRQTAKAKLPKPPRHWRIIEQEVDGVKRSFLTIGALARALDRHVSTLRVWEAEGLLPTTPYRTDSGQRLYTMEQLQELRARREVSPKMRRASTKRPTEVVKTVVWADGREEKISLHNVRFLADEIKRTPQTIRLMERKNGMPPTPLKTKGQRLYTYPMVEVVKRACLGNKYASSWPEIYIYVLMHWQELGVLGGQVVEDGDGDQGEGSGSGSV